MFTNTPAKIKQTLRNGLAGWRQRQRPPWPQWDKYSNFGEEGIIADHFARHGLRNEVFVDIGAGDGVDASNTCRLALAGWRGLAVEADVVAFTALSRNWERFPQVVLTRDYATAPGVHAILQCANIPQNFDFLSLDIDSVDFWVLEALLRTHRPRLICVEINETIPPPLAFTLLPGARPDIALRLFGMSLSQVTPLARSHGYGLLCVEFNNAFFAPLVETGVDADDFHAYREGYLERPRRPETFYWNADWEAIYDLRPDAALAFVRAKFASSKENNYRLDLEPTFAS